MTAKLAQDSLGERVRPMERNALRQTIERLVKERLQFEELISCLSAKFINLPSEKVNSEIKAGLQLIGEFLDADRVTLMVNTKDGKYIETSFSWLSDRVERARDIFPKKNTEKLHKRLYIGKEYKFKQVTEIPRDWSGLRKYVSKIGIKSALILPLKVGGRLLGAIGIDFFCKEYDWPDELVRRLKFIAHVFANALARKETEERLQTTLSELNQLKGQLEADCVYLQDEIKLEHNFDEIIGKSLALKTSLLSVEKVAPTDATVLILGETGTGKELIARAIHGASPRKDRPLVKVNCAALAPTLIESELFGHAKGAFTGADSKVIGRFELADGGTIFLDEVAELPLELQPKLLRVLQEGEFEPLGSSLSIKVDVRIIAASNRDLEKEVQAGRFRKDLWYRLNVFPIVAPPLRERTEDIPLLVNWFTKKFNRKHGKSIRMVPQRTMEALLRYPWPGNIRELQNVVERAVIIGQSDRLHVDLPDTRSFITGPMKTLEEIEREHIIMVLKKTKWRIAGPKGAAKILAINPNTLRARMKKVGIVRPGY